MQMIYLLLFFGGWQGFVISDWQGIDRITTPEHANYSYSVLAGVNAGIDMVSVASIKWFQFCFFVHCF